MEAYICGLPASLCRDGEHAQPRCPSSVRELPFNCTLLPRISDQSGWFVEGYIKSICVRCFTGLLERPKWVRADVGRGWQQGGDTSAILQADTMEGTSHTVKQQLGCRWGTGKSKNEGQSRDGRPVRPLERHGAEQGLPSRGISKVDVVATPSRAGEELSRLPPSVC